MQPPVCSPHALRDRHSVCLDMVHIVPSGLSLDDVLAPSYWRNAWKVLERKEMSTIELISDDNTWEARVRVLAVSEGVVKLRVVSKWEPEKKAGPKPAAPDGYRVEFISGKGWRAVDPAGVEIGTEPTEPEAITLAQAHAKKSRRAA